MDGMPVVAARRKFTHLGVKLCSGGASQKRAQPYQRNFLFHSALSQRIYVAVICPRALSRRCEGPFGHTRPTIVLLPCVATHGTTSVVRQEKADKGDWLGGRDSRITWREASHRASWQDNGNGGRGYNSSPRRIVTRRRCSDLCNG